MKMLTFFLIFSLFAFRATGTGTDEKTALLSKSNAIVKATDFSPFQSLPDEMNNQVLGYLVDGGQKGATGFFFSAHQQGK